MARLGNVDPELALRRATGRFMARIARAELLAGADGLDWPSLSLAEQDAYFDRAKREETVR